MLFLKQNEFVPLNINNSYALVSKHFDNLNLEWSIMTDQQGISNDNINIHVAIYENSNKNRHDIYKWDLPISARSLRDLMFDIAQRIRETLEFKQPYCLERFMTDYFIFSNYSPERKMFELASLKVSHKGQLLIPEFPDDVMELIRLVPEQNRVWISMSRIGFKKLANDLTKACDLVNTYYYLLVHVNPGYMSQGGNKSDD
jgi:hypothetical protein